MNRETRIVKVACGNIPDEGNDAWLLFRLKGNYRWHEKVRVTVERLDKQKEKDQ